MLVMNPMPPTSSFNSLLAVLSKLNEPRLNIIPMFRKLYLMEMEPNLIVHNILLNCFCKLHQADWGFAVFGGILKSGFSPSSLNLSTLIEALCAENRFWEAAKLFNKTVELGYWPNVNTYATLIRGICGLENPEIALQFHEEQARELFLKMKSRGFCLTVVFYNTMIHGFCKCGMFVEIPHLLLDMAVQDIHPNVITYNMIITALCRESQIKVEKILGSLCQIDGGREIKLSMATNQGKHDVAIYSSLINGYYRGGIIGAAMEIFMEMSINGVHPDIFTYNALFAGLSKNGLVYNVMELFTEMKTSGISPNIFVYNSFIHALCSAGMFIEAENLFNEMVDEGVGPNTSTFNVIINALCAQGKVDEAKVVFESMNQNDSGTVTYSDYNSEWCDVGRISDAGKSFISIASKGRKHDVISYNCLLNGYVRCGRIDEAMTLFWEMIPNGVCPDVIIYNTLFTGLFQQGRVGIAYSMLRDMHIYDLKPDLCTYTIFLNGLCSNKCILEAVELFHSLKNSAYALSIEHLFLLIDSLRKTGMVEEAMNVFSEAVAIGGRPSAKIYNSLLIGLFQEGRVRDCHILLQEMHVSGVMPNSSTYSIYLNGLCNNYCASEAVKLFYSMDKGALASIRHLICLIDGLCKAGEPEMAYRLLGELHHKSSLKPTIMTYTMVIKSLCCRRQMKKACKLFLEIEESDCVPNIVTYNTLLFGFFYNNDKSSFFNLLQKMVTKGISPSEYTISMSLKLFSGDDRYLECLKQLHPLFKECQVCK